MLERIRASLAALSPAEQRVARLVLADPRSFSTLPVGQLAERARVSKPTVVRFCRSVGYDGLADFKRRLAGNVNEDVPFVHRAVDEGDKPGEVVVKVVDNAVAALLKYRNEAAGHAFERAIAALVAAARSGRRIEFYGVGSSGVVAQDAQHRFLRLGLRCAAASDAHVQAMGATLMQPGDCAVLISRSGRSRELLEAAGIVRRRGATAILMTASGSPLAQAAQGAHQVLIAVDRAEDDDRDGPMVARLLQLVVVDILATAVALRLPGELRPVPRATERHPRAKRQVPA